MSNLCRLGLAVERDRAERVLEENKRLKSLEGGDFLLKSEREYEGGKDWLYTKDGFQAAAPKHNQYLAHLAKTCNVTPKIILFGERGDGPPADLITELSQKYPDLTFWLSYDVEFLWDNATYRIKNGEWELMERRVGWFRSMRAPYDAPVHHHVAVFANDPATVAKIKELADANTIYRTETSRYTGRDAWAFRCDPDSLGVEIDHEPLAYTLEEETYLASMHERAREAERHTVKLCECPSRLSKDETDFVVAHDMPDVPADLSDGELNNEAPIATEIHLKVLAHKRRRLDIYTTRADLQVLLTKPDLSPERRAAIQAAMMKPAWTRSWPEWKDVMTPPESPPVSSDDDFLEQLKNM